MAHQNFDNGRPTKGTMGRLVPALFLVVVFVLGSVAAASAQSFWDELLAGFESSIGAAVADDVRSEYGQPARLGTAQQRWVDTIFADIVLQAGRRDITYSLEVLDSDVVNAFAAPGGYIFITTALLHHIGNDTDALANVLGHEVAHVEHRHGMNALGRNLGLSLLLQLAFGNPSEGDEVWQVIAGVAVGLMQLGWSRDQEHESDDLGQRLAAAAGYDPHGMVRFFRVLQELQGMEVPFLEFLSTHPLTSERIGRAESRAASLSVSPRTAPKPFLPGPLGGGSVTRPGPAAGVAAASEVGSQGRVVSRHGPAAGGIVYEDPAGRFSLRLPPGLSPDPQLYLDATRFTGAEGASVWVWVQRAQPEDRIPRIAVNRTLRFYQELYPDFLVENVPWDASLAGRMAEYAQYTYTDPDGAPFREGSYFMLHEGSLYIVQFAEPAAAFDDRRGVYEAMAQSFVLGPEGYGRVDWAVLTDWPLTEVTVGGSFAMQVPSLWPMTWERPADQVTEETAQIAEFFEIGERGYMAMFEYESEFGMTAEDTAADWLRFVLDTRSGAQVHEPVHPRPRSDYDAASFVVSWADDGTRWTQYSTTFVSGGVSYEIGIVYEADGFDARRAAFDRWVDSWRHLGV